MNANVNINLSVDSSNIDETVKLVARLMAALASQEIIHVNLGSDEKLFFDKVIDQTTPEKKVRKQRAPLTEAETQIVKVRFANDRIKAALARGDEPRPQDLETVAEKVPAGTFTTVVVDSKPAKVAKKTKAEVEAEVDSLMEVAKQANGKLKDAVKAGKYTGKKVVRTEKQATAK